FDAFDIHWFGSALNNDYFGIRAVVDEVRNLLAAHGYGATPIWATETATYSDTPEGWSTQTQIEQARDLAKRLIYYRSLDIGKIFWTPLIEFHEWKGIPNQYFDNTGLINNPQNDGDSSEKKAYFTYQFLASKLDGAVVQFDSEFMQRIAASVARGCEFSNNNRSYYAIWFDDPAYAGSTVSFPTAYETFKVYTLVPNESNEIPVEVVQRVDGKFEYVLGMDPILIEYTPIEVTYPQANSSLDTPAVAVEGFVDMGQEVTFVNPPDGSPVMATGDPVDGSFLFSAQTFPEGLNTIHLSVQHAPGVSSEIYVDFVVDTQPPAISNVTALHDTTDVIGPYAVEATITDGDQVLSAKLCYTIDGGVQRFPDNRLARTSHTTWRPGTLPAIWRPAIRSTSKLWMQNHR
ncbi:MAG: hypothetical protein HY801_06455, partial [Candidatus Lindowbacteria bacterium]|nr:hypothetical protein [Candidatus Lindowbacteria bacterium]